MTWWFSSNFCKRVTASAIGLARAQLSQIHNHFAAGQGLLRSPTISNSKKNTQTLNSRFTNHQLFVRLSKRQKSTSQAKRTSVVKQKQIPLVDKSHEIPYSISIHFSIFILCVLFYFFPFSSYMNKSNLPKTHPSHRKSDLTFCLKRDAGAKSSYKFSKAKA